jgi:hypothetical protein
MYSSSQTSQHETFDVANLNTNIHHLSLSNIRNQKQSAESGSNSSSNVSSQGGGHGSYHHQSQQQQELINQRQGLSQLSQFEQTDDDQIRTQNSHPHPRRKYRDGRARKRGGVTTAAAAADDTTSSSQSIRSHSQSQRHQQQPQDQSMIDDDNNMNNLLLSSQQSSIPVEITKEDHIISKVKQLTVYHSPIEVIDTIRNYVTQRNPGNALSDPPFTVEFPTTLSRYKAIEQFNQNHPLTLMDLFYTVRYYHRVWCYDIMGPMERIARNLLLFDHEILDQVPSEFKNTAERYTDVRQLANRGQGVDEINSPAGQDFARIYGWWNNIRHLFIRRHLKKTKMYKDEPPELLDRLCTVERTSNLIETYEDVFTNVILCHLDDPYFGASEAIDDLKNNTITRLIYHHQNIISVIGLAISGEYSHAFSAYLDDTQQFNLNTCLDQITHRMLSVVTLISEYSLCCRQASTGIEIYNGLNARNVNGDNTVNRSIALGIQNKFFVDATKPSLRGMRYSFLMNPLTMCTSTDQQIKLIEILTAYTHAEQNNQDDPASDDQSNSMDINDGDNGITTTGSQQSGGRGRGKKRKPLGRGGGGGRATSSRSLLTAANKQHALIQYFLILMFKHGYRKHIKIAGGSALNASSDQIHENTYVMCPQQSSIAEFRHLYTGAFKLSCRLIEFIQSHWTSDVLIAHQTFFPMNDILGQYKQITQNIASVPSEERFPMFKPHRRLISFASGRAGVVTYRDPHFKSIVYARYVYMSHTDIQQKSVSLGSIMNARTSMSVVKQYRQKFIQELHESEDPSTTLINESPYFSFDESEELFLSISQRYASHVFIDQDANDAYKGVYENVIEPMENLVNVCRRRCAVVDYGFGKESDVRKMIWQNLIENIGISMENLILNDGCTLFEEFFLLHMGMDVTGPSRYQTMMKSSTTKPHIYESYGLTKDDCFQALACLLCLFGTYLIDRCDDDLRVDVFVLLIGASNIGKSKILEMFDMIYEDKAEDMNISSETTFQLFPVLEKEPYIVLCHEFSEKASLSKTELLSWVTEYRIRLAWKGKSSVVCSPVAKFLGAGNASPARAWSEQGNSRDQDGNSKGGAMARRLVVLTLHQVPDFEKKDVNVVKATQKKELPKVICRMMSILCIMRPFLPEMQDYINQVKYFAIMHREFIRSMDIIKPFFQDHSFFEYGDGYVLALSDLRSLTHKFFETSQSSATLDAYFQEAIQYLKGNHPVERMICLKDYLPITANDRITLQHVDVFKGVRHTNAARVLMKSGLVNPENEHLYNVQQ